MDSSGDKWQPPSALPQTTIAHPWHGVGLHQKSPDMVNAVVEIPRGSRTKYEIDKATGLIKLDRVLHTSMQYPIHYGIIPQTLCGDGDPLDILVYTTEPLVPLTLLVARVVGYMPMTENGKQDDKILAVAHTDASTDTIQSLADFPNGYLAIIQHFFNHYKTPEGSIITTGEWQNASEAHKVIQGCVHNYSNQFTNTKILS